MVEETAQKEAEKPEVPVEEEKPEKEEEIFDLARMAKILGKEELSIGEAIILDSWLERKYGKKTDIESIAQKLKGGEKLSLAEMMLLDSWMERKFERRNPLDSDKIVSQVVAKLKEEGVIAKKEEMPDWAKEIQKQQQEILQRLRKEEEEKQRKELIGKVVEEALAPYKEQISQLQQLVSSKTAGMTENEKRGFFQTLGEQIEQSLSQEVTSTIAKNIADAIMKAFTPKEEEVPVTAEGKVDTYRMVDKWVKRGLDAIRTLAERWPTSKPPIREVQKLPITTTPQPTIAGATIAGGAIAGVSAPATQQTATITPPTTSTTATPATVTTTTSPQSQPPEIKEEKPPEKEEGEKPVEQKAEEPKETGAGHAEPSEKAAGKRAKRKEP